MYILMTEAKENKVKNISFPMKFRKNSASSSPKMDLLRRPLSRDKMSNFKRSKSFRASVKLISKIRNHANNHLGPSYDLPSVSLNPEGCENIQGKIHSLSLVSEDSIPEVDGSKTPTDSNEIAKSEVSKVGAVLKEKLSLNDNGVPQEILKERDKLSVKTNEFNAYENPTFMDSSLDSSVSSFFHEDDLDASENLGKFEKKEISSSIMKGERKKQRDNGLTVIVESGEQVCKMHRWCTQAQLIGKNIFRVTKDSGNKCKNGNDNNAINKIIPYQQIIMPEAPRQKTEKSDKLSKPSFHSKTKSAGKSNTKELLTGGMKQTNSSETKLHSLQGMEFLEGLGKKKQQQHQRLHQYQLNNLSSIHINPITAQPSLNIHLHALFAAVEHGHLDKARAILETTDVNVNSVNSDGLSPLDVAVLSNNRPLAKMLVAFGAQEGNQFKSPESLGSHLASLLSEAEHRVQELGGGSVGAGSGSSSSSAGGLTLLEPPSASQSHRGSFSSQHNNLTGCGGSAEDKQLALWERRARALRKMLLGFDQARPPDMPFFVTVDVTSTTSVSAKFQESETQESPICTKFKIQWSVKEDFSIVCGERELLDMKQKECRVEGLLQGHRYYFRAAAGNLKGYSRFRPTTPAHLTPSSWRDIDGRLARFAGRLEQLDNLFTDVRGAEYSLETPAVQRRNHKKKTTIKQLFTATSKFQKNLRRGCFLSCLLYHEDKVLVTNEDFLPVIEVDETYPSCILNDFHWLMKVACTWDDVKGLKQDMEKSHSSSTNHFRIKLLQAATQMQAALCTQDLGQFYHRPIRDVQGTLVFSSVNYVRSPKLVSVLNSRWLPLSKVTKKLITHEDSNVADILMASIQDQMTYHQVSSIKLSRGLYLGYLKMQSSVDSIQVVVPTKSPNVLPHCKIRDNPHVSAEEWEYLKRMGRLQASYNELGTDAESEEKENASNELQGSEQQKLFIDMVAATVRRLLSHMDIGSDESLTHRLYDAEVIELTSDVSFLIAVPPAETACSVPGTREILLQRGDLLSLPVQVFEMVHLATYQRDVMNRYSRLSCILELDTAQAQHNHREAFSTSELTIAKDKLARLQDLQSQMNTVWKGARWLIDVITFARDRAASSQATAGICIKYLLSLDRNRNSGSVVSLKRSLLQLPPRDPKLVKSSPGRGSWPGPSVSNASSLPPTNLLTTEFSKSEQQLTLGPYPIGCRKGSNSSNCSSGSEMYKSTPSAQTVNKMPQQGKLPPSKSEDTLLLGKYSKHSPRSRSSAASASTSPLLGVKHPNCASSESTHSISSGDEYSTKQSQFKKPTASVAATATEEKDEAGPRSGALLPGILQVYAAYETGLASGTSLKLHVTARTTAREVVELVVKQLNMAVLLKGLDGPCYSQEELTNFCLVAVIGARERCLRDDFKPLQLQNPWKKGRLYVRQKQDVLAALEHSSKHTAYL